MPTRLPSGWDKIARASGAAATLSLQDAFGGHPRQQLTWLGLFSLPLLLPVTIPGMASMVGALCMVVALGIALARPLPLPAWLAGRRLPPRASALLARLVTRVVGKLAPLSRPRWIALTHPNFRLLNGGVLGLAGLSMVAPVPVISFDNVLPAAAILLVAWGLRMRDGWLLIAGYVATVVALCSVLLLWWGGAELVLWLTRMAL